MKRILGVLMSIILVASLCGCGKNESATSSDIVEVIYEEETIYEGGSAMSNTIDETISSELDSSYNECVSSDNVNTSSDNTSSETAENKLLLNDSKVLEKIKLNGRTQKTKEGIVLDYTASAIEFNTNSSSVLLQIEADAGVYYSVFVDDELKTARGVTEQGVNFIVLARGLQGGQHNIKFVRSTEGRSYNSMTAVYLQLDEGKELVDSAKNDSGVLIEFLGDSMTSGYGNLIESGSNNVSDFKYEDSLNAYPYLVASKLGFDYRIISMSGIALKERKINTTTYPTFYDFYKLENYYKDKSTLYTSSNPQDVDIVVVNLGTNDAANKTLSKNDGEMIAEYIDIYTNLITKIGYAKDTKIVFISGIMWCHDQLPAYNGAKDKLNALGYNNVYVYDIPTYRTDGNHPSVKDHKDIAEKITKFFKEKGVV